ncbi:MAG TPA: EAL domain-containing protein [Streptosporangiaceae bacterium]|nr:EAL domain-containing protein [Streptosporangiaceae bacterium]
MSAAVQASVLALVAAAAAVSLLRGASRHAGRVKHAYRWFALGGLLWAACAVAAQAPGATGLGAGYPLTLADLPGLLALPAVLAGLAALSPRHPATDPAAQRSLRARFGSALARLADGYVLAAAGFMIGWITLFGPAYTRFGGPLVTFAAGLVHPAADLVALGCALPLMVAAGRRGIAPFTALVLVTAGDALAVGARVGSTRPGLASQLLVIIGLLVLGSAPWLPAARRQQHAAVPASTAEPAAPLVLAGLDAATVLAALAASAAALVVIGWALTGGTVATTVVAVTGGTAVLALAGRILIMVRHDRMTMRLLRESGQQFRELADASSDVVLICDFAGAILSASPGVSGYGYRPDEVENRNLAELLHPEDRPGAIRAVRALQAQAPGPARGPVATIFRHRSYSCRVRAADGTWQHVEATLSRYRNLGSPDRLLVTARDVSDRVELRMRIAQLTYHDGLTGLPNRAYLEARATEVLGADRRPPARVAGGEPAVNAVILADLDQFARVNDLAGRGAGDLVLTQVARTLREMVPPQQTVGRWSGDEFGILVEDAGTLEDAIDLAERIAVRISDEPFQADGREIPLSVSVGLAVADGSPAGTLWRNAATALARARTAGGSRAEAYPARQAGEGRLDIQYQPIVELATSRITGVEAQPCWPRDSVAGGLSGPHDGGEAGTDLAGSADWLLRQATDQAAHWHRSGWEAGLLVHCPSQQAQAPGFAESVLAALSSAGLPYRSLTLEIDAGPLAAAGDAATEAMRALRRRGVRLAAAVSAEDDAGSLARVSELPVDVVRIGPALIAGMLTDPAVRALVSAMVRAARDLGIEVAANGIEQPGQRELLAELGCGLGQGGLLARPMGRKAVAALAIRGLARDGAVSPAETNALSS